MLMGVAEPPRLPQSIVLLGENFTGWPDGFQKVLKDYLGRAMDFRIRTSAGLDSYSALATYKEYAELKPGRGKRSIDNTISMCLWSCADSRCYIPLKCKHCSLLGVPLVPHQNPDPLQFRYMSFSSVFIDAENSRRPTPDFGGKP